MSSVKPNDGRLSFERGLYTSEDPTKLDDGFVVATSRNVRLGELGSVTVRDGFTSPSTLPAALTNNVVGLKYYEASDGTRTPVASNGTQVFVLEAIGWTLVGTFPIAGTVFRAQMDGDFLVMVNGASLPHALRRSSATTWEFREVGLDKPSAPTTVAGTGVADLTEPAFGDVYFTTLHPTVGAAGSVYGSTNSGSGFAKYDISTNAWATQSARPSVQQQHQVMERISTAKVVYAPGIFTAGPVADGILQSTGRVTHYYDPISNTWTANKALSDGTAWGPGSDVATSPSPWQGTDLAMIYFYGAGAGNMDVGWVLSSLSEGGTTTTTTPVTGAFESLNVADDKDAFYDRVSASKIVPTNSPNIVFVLYDVPATGKTNLVRVDVGTGASTQTGISQPTFRLTRFDRAVYPGGDEILIYQEGTNNIFRYRISANSWDSLTDVAVHNRGIVGGTPVNSLVYAFRAGPGTDFISTVVPGSVVGAGSLDFKVAVTLVDNTGHESTVSDATLVEDIPTGSQINLTIPTSAKTYVTSRKIYSTLSNDVDGPLFFVQEVPNNTATSVSISSANSFRIKTIIAPDDNGKPGTGPEFVSSFEGRLVLAAFTGKRSRISFSKTTNPFGFSDALIQDFKARGRVMGLARGASFLAVPMSSSTFVFPGDPLEFSAALRLTDYGCDRSETVFEADTVVGWLSEKGLVFFDGFNAARFDQAVSNLVTEMLAALRVSVSVHRRLLRFSYQDPADATRTKVLVYELDKTRWLLDEYPVALRAIEPNEVGFSVAVGMGGSTRVDNTTIDFSEESDVALFEPLFTPPLSILSGGGTLTVTFAGGGSFGAKVVPGTHFHFAGGAILEATVVAGLVVTFTANAPANGTVLNEVRGLRVTGGKLTMTGTAASAPTVTDATRDFSGEDDVQITIPGDGLENLEDPLGQTVTARSDPGPHQGGMASQYSVTLDGTMNSKVTGGCNMKFVAISTIFKIKARSANTLTIDDVPPALSTAVEWIRGNKVFNGVLSLTDAPSATRVVGNSNQLPALAPTFGNDIAQTFSYPTAFFAEVIGISLSQSGPNRYDRVELWQGAPTGVVPPWTATTLLKTLYTGAEVNYPSDFSHWLIPGGINIQAGVTYTLRIYVTNPAKTVGVQYGSGAPPGNFFNAAMEPGKVLSFRFEVPIQSALRPTANFYQARTTPKTSWPGFFTFSADPVTVTDSGNTSPIFNRYAFRFSVAGALQYWDGASWQPFVNADTTVLTAAVINTLTDAQMRSAGGFTAGTPYLELVSFQETLDGLQTPTLDQVTIQYSSPSNLPLNNDYKAELLAITSYPNFISFPATALDLVGESAPASSSVRYAFRFGVGGPIVVFSGGAWITLVGDPITNGMTLAAVEALTSANWLSASGFLVGAPYRQTIVFMKTTVGSSIPSLDAMIDSYLIDPASTVSIPEGVSSVSGTSLIALDQGLTDGGATIDAKISPVSFSREAAARETNWSSFLLDVDATGAYSISVNTDIDGRSHPTVHAVTGVAGRKQHFRRLGFDHVGRILKLTLTLPKVVTLRKLFVSPRVRLRRAI